MVQQDNNCLVNNTVISCCVLLVKSLAHSRPLCTFPNNRLQGIHVHSLTA